MPRNHPLHRRPRTTLVATLALGMTLLSAAAVAADAHKAVQAKPGEIVLLRDVATRPAYRQAPPGMALIVDPSPRHELANALGTDELSDADYASLSATSNAPAGSHATTVERIVGGTLKGSVGASPSRNGAAGNGFSNVISGPVGAVGNTTRGIGNQVQGALSQIPMPMTPVPGSH